MQSIISRRSASALVSAPARLPSRISCPPAILARTYAQQAPDTNVRSPKPEGPSEGNKSRLPLFAAVGLATMIPLFYFTQGTQGTGKKSPGSEQSSIREIRNKKGTSGEYRDPRDSGRKTTEADGKGK